MNSVGKAFKMFNEMCFVLDCMLYLIIEAVVKAVNIKQ